MCDPDPRGFYLVATPCRVEIDRVQRSRFIGSVARAESVEEALAFVESVRSDLHDARHHAFAWRIGETQPITRSADDGEPHHSAGSPILREIEGRNLTHTVVVVTRYFGGVKLGTGGLSRAYGAAAAAVLDQAGVRFVPITVPIIISYPYELTGAVAKVLHHLGLEPAQSSYGELAEITLRVDPSSVDRVVTQVREASAGVATISVGVPTAGSLAAV